MVLVLTMKNLKQKNIKTKAEKNILQKGLDVSRQRVISNTLRDK